jgi:hypothetical protein
LRESHWRLTLEPIDDGLPLGTNGAEEFADDCSERTDRGRRASDDVLELLE